MADRNLILQLLITAKDDASAAFAKLYKWLDNETSVVAGKVRDAFTGLFGGSLDSAAEMESALDAVAAKGGYTADEMGNLKKEAEKVAAQFGVTGTEAAKGLEILAAAGLSATDAVKALPPVLALSRSEGVSLDVAAERLADSLAIMGLGFDQAGRMADVLAKGANLSTVSAIQLSEALATCGGTAKAAGMDLETTIAALDLLAKNGIKGSEAGTALNAVLIQLLNPASTASAELNKLGISSRDLGTVLDRLKAAANSNEAAILAFGETAGPALRALIGEGSAGLQDLTAKLEDAKGAAGEASDQMAGNFKAAMEALTAAWDAVKRTLMEPVLEPLAKAAKALSKAFQDAIDSGAFSALQQVVKDVAVAVSDAATVLVKAFDFKAMGEGVTEFVAVGLNGLSQAMNNVAAIAGALAAGALIPLALQLKAGYDATMAFIAAQRTAAAAMTATELATKALSAAKSVLFGPVGWVMMGVSALALLWQEEDKTKAATDALAVSTADYTKKLKEQTEAQNKAALYKLEDALAAQRTELGKLSQELQKQQKIQENGITVWTDLGEEINVHTDNTKKVTIAQAAYDEKNKEVIATEQRRQAVIDELKAKQAAANPVADAAAEATKKQREALEKAITAFAAAREEVDKATPGTKEYGIAQGKLANAHNAVNEAAKAVTKAESDHNAEIQRLIREEPKAEDALKKRIQAMEEEGRKLDIGVSQSNKYADAVEGVVNAELSGTKAAIKLATAKGDTAEVQRLTIKLSEQEADGAVKIAKAKQAEQEAEAELAAKKLEIVKLKKDNNQATQEELELAELTAQKEVAEAQAAGVNTEAQIQLAAALRQVNAAKSGATGATQENTTATEQNTGAQEKGVKVVDNLGKMHTALISSLQAARERMSELSETAGAYFEAMLQGTVNAQGLDGAFKSAGIAANALNNALEGSTGDTGQLAKFESAAAQAGAALGKARQDMLQTVNMLDTYTTAMELAEASTRKIYYEQAAGAERLRLSIEDMTRSGQISAQELQLAAQAADGEFNMLDAEDLSGLRGAIDDANDKLREMQQETQDAQDALAEMNAELLAEQGDTAGADRLKLQIEESQRLADLEQKRREAEQTGNKEAAASYAEMIRKLGELYAAKSKNLEEDIKSRTEQERTTKTQTDTTGALAANLERAANAVAALNGASLSGLQGQVQGLYGTVERLRGIL